MVEDGELIRDPAFPEFPSFLEAYSEAFGKEPSGQVWDAYLALVSSGVSAQRQVWVHQDIPQEALGALKEATQCVVERDEFYRSEEHTSELQSLMRISYAVFCLKKKTTNKDTNTTSKT